jgi:PAS domain S-box-containing protein
MSDTNTSCRINMCGAVNLIIQIGAIVFFAECVVALARNNFVFDLATTWKALMVATLLTAIVAPVCYVLLLRPFLMRTITAREALASALEVSRSKEAELAVALSNLELQKSILDHHCLVSRTDAKGRITYANAEFCRVSGYAREELVGSNHAIVKSGMHGDEFWQAMYGALERDGMWQGQVCNRAKDGSLYWVQATNVAHKDANGKVIDYISIRSNITETKLREQELFKAHEELKEAIARAEAASRAKSGFLSTMSHEMRTPLNGVIGAMELLRLEQLTVRQSKLVDLAMQSSEALLVHINDVLDFSKMEAGKLELVPAPFDLRKLVNSVVDIVKPLAGNGGNRIAAEVCDELPQGLLGDRIRLRQILLNFASNAAKFTRNGAITLTVTPVASSSGKSVIEFAVTDTGLGIPADRLGELFKEFSMLDSSYTRRTGGTGLGLAISKSLAEAMGGRIGVESEEGKGSRFWFTVELPHVEITEAGTTGGASGHAATAQRLCVLLVDDNATNRLVGSQLLAAAGHEVALAAGGHEAAEAAAKRSFDVILMDISMPEVDGLEATRIIRAQSQLNQDTPIIALTAHAVAGDRERFLAAGMNDYLSKPFRLADLEARLSGVQRRVRDGSDVAGDAKAATPDEPLLDQGELDLLAEQTSAEIVPVVVEEFLKEMHVRVTEHSHALRDRNRYGLQSVCHAIAGASSSVGARRLGSLAKSIEMKCIAGEDEEAFKRSARIANTLAETEAAYREHLARLAGTPTADRAAA